MGENFIASIIVPSTEQEGYATFTATIENNYNDHNWSYTGQSLSRITYLMIITVTLNTSTYALTSSLYKNGIQALNLNLNPSPTVSVNSNNSNSAYAKTGDNLSIGFSVTDTISNGSATILGLDAHVSHVGENFIASIIVPSTEQEGYATFTATIENNYNDIIGLTQDNFLGSNVFVDNVGPKISLDGSDPYYLVHNFSINVIPTATVTDGDPNYPEVGYTITTSNNLNPSEIGSTLSQCFGIAAVYRIITAYSQACNV